MSPLHRPLRALSANALSGIGVACGIGLAQGLAHLVGGPAAALAAASGAVYASLADLPNPPHRGWRRVLTAAIVGCAVSLVVGVLRAHPVALGVAVGLIGFGSAMTLAWGARAGPLSFVGILAFVFSMALPPMQDAAESLHHAGWTALGGGGYLLWSVAVGWLLRRRYRTLALAAVLDALARLLRSRATLSADAVTPRQGAARARARMAQEARLDERLQAARDLLFAAPQDEATARRQVASLLLATDLRETLLLGELDLDLIGSDAPGAAVRQAMDAGFEAVAAALQAIGTAWRLRRPAPSDADPGDAFGSLAEDSAFSADDPRARLLHAMRERAQHLLDDLQRLRALLDGADVQVPLRQAELQLFVSGEGWPLAALKRNATPHSPVLRHAVRMGVALACAYGLGLALPWASHPYWLVLSVAVVLRGTLEQTLSRRNARVAGTVAGCLIVLALVRGGADGPVAATAFLIAAGLAHAFVTTRYGVTAAAATVMALLQAHMVHALGVHTLAERLADTLLGALLAWAFSYVLPSWERQSLGRLTARVRGALSALASAVLEPPGEQATVELRLARREAYEALGALAAAAQRGSVEPRRVRVPPPAFERLLAHGHALLAHLAAVKVLLTRRGAELDAAETQRLLREALPRVQQALAGRTIAAERPSGADPEDTEPASTPYPWLPDQLPSRALASWLERRLRLATLTAERVGRSATALLAAARRGGDRL